MFCDSKLPFFFLRPSKGYPSCVITVSFAFFPPNAKFVEIHIPHVQPTQGSCLGVRLIQLSSVAITFLQNCCVGGLHHEFETDGKVCNTTSTLIVHTYSKNSTVHCIIRHKGLQGRKLVAPFQFEDLGKKNEWFCLAVFNLA